MRLRPLQPTHHYIRLAVEPPCADSLLIRKVLQDALTEMFGITFGGTHIDVLSVNAHGSETVVRVNPADAPRILAAIAGSSASIRCAVVKASSFLPSLAQRTDLVQ